MRLTPGSTRGTLREGPGKEAQLAKGNQEYSTSIRVKCSPRFKRQLRSVATDWDNRKAGRFDMSGVLRVLGDREITRLIRRRKKERAGGEA